MNVKKMEIERLINKNNIINPTSIADFKWESVTYDAENLATYLVYPQSIDKVCWNEYNTTFSHDFPKQLQISAERNFGSYWEMYRKFKNSEDEKSKWLKNLRNRYSQIKQLFSTGIIDSQSCSEYWENIINFIVDYYARSSKSKNGSYVIGWQIAPRFTPQDIKAFPVEALIRAIGAYPRLVVIEKYEELSSHPDFFKASSLDKIFGLFSRWNNQEKGKQ